MSNTVAELAQKGRALKAKDRERLVELLITSLAENPDPDVEEAWRLEINRRVESYESGNATLHEIDEVMAEAKLIAP